MIKRIFLVRLQKHLTTYSKEHNKSVATFKAAQTLIKALNKQIADLPRPHPNGKPIPEELDSAMVDLLHTRILLRNSESGFDSDAIFDGSEDVGLSEMNNDELVEEFLAHFLPDPEAGALTPRLILILKQLKDLGYDISVAAYLTKEDEEVQCIPDGDKRWFQAAEDQFEDPSMWGEDTYAAVQAHFDQPCTVVCLNTFSALGEIDFEYYDIKFDDGVVLSAISGLHLHDKVE